MMVSPRIYLLLALLMFIIPASCISYAGTLTNSECKAYFASDDVNKNLQAYFSCPRKLRWKSKKRIAQHEKRLLIANMKIFLQLLFISIMVMSIMANIGLLVSLTEEECRAYFASNDINKKIHAYFNCPKKLRPKHKRDELYLSKPYWIFRNDRQDNLPIEIN